MAAQTAGQSTSFGSYVTAKGGSPGEAGDATNTYWDGDYEVNDVHTAKGGLSGNGIDKGGDSTSGTATDSIAGGGGGAGGYQIGLFLQGGPGGNGSGSYNITRTAGKRNGGGAGAGYTSESHSPTEGGPGGGGRGGVRGNPGEESYTYLHSGLDNSGAILLFW